MRGLATLIMRGPPMAALVAAVSSVLALLIPPLALIGGAAIALTTLRNGPRHGLLVLVLATAGGSLMALLAIGTPSLAPAMALLLWLPVLVLAGVLRASISLALAFQVAALLGVLAVLGFYLVLGDPAAWWRGITVDMLNQLERADVFPSPEVRSQFGEVFDAWAPLAPGQLVLSLLLGVLLALLLARWWQALLYNPGGFREEFHELRLGRPLAALTAALFGLSLLLAQPLLINLCLALVAVYLFQGIAIMHGVAGRAGLAKAWLVTFYLALLLLPALWQLLLVLALVDAWIDFRARVKPAPHR